MASSFLGFLDHTKPRITVGRTTLDEWSAHSRDLYLTTHNTHDRQTSMPPVGFEPTISAVERPQTYALDRAATGTGCVIKSILNIFSSSLNLYFIIGWKLIYCSFISAIVIGWLCCWLPAELGHTTHVSLQEKYEVRKTNHKSPCVSRRFLLFTGLPNSSDLRPLRVFLFNLKFCSREELWGGKRRSVLERMEGERGIGSEELCHLPVSK